MTHDRWTHCQCSECVSCVVSASAQYVYTVIVRLTYKNRIFNFIDLCSTANVSVFLLTAQRYGHYIHGQCVHGASDVSMSMWYENFRAEAVRFATSILNKDRHILSAAEM